MEEIVNRLLNEVGIAKEYHERIWHYLTVLRNRHEATYHHVIRVGGLASKIAVVADIPNVTPKMMLWAGLLHDVGKALIPPELLSKTEAFDAADYAVMEDHVMYGWRMLQQVFDFSAHIIVRHHQYGKHPYPKELPALPVHLELKRGIIDSAARLLALADYYDAITTRKNDKHWGEELTMRDIFIRDNHDCEALILKLEEAGVFNFNPWYHLDYSEIEWRVAANLSNKEANFRDMYLGNWEDTNDYVHSREKVSGMFERGEISKPEAEHMLRLRYRTKKNGRVYINEPENNDEPESSDYTPLL